MSADIWIESAECCSGHDHNVTHNLAPMFRAVGLDWHDFWEHDGNGGKTAADMLPRAVLAYRALRDNPEDYEHLNPPNGWGDLPGGSRYDRPHPIRVPARKRDTQ